MKTARLPIAARRHPVVTALARGLESSCGSAALGPVVLGASGGGDSTAMLLAVSALSERADLDIRPIVVHVNHHLRVDAVDDAEHVRHCCEGLGIECEIIDVHPRRTGEDARIHRYEAILAAAVRHGVDHVLVAHHAEDQLETIIAALGRGAGPEGLAGMAPCRPLGDSVQLVRPLLGVSKHELHSMCEAAGMTWREDPTNVDPSTLRGRLRRDVIPVLESIWPGAARRSANNASLLRAASDALQREVQSAFGSATAWSRHALQELDPVIRSAGLRRALLDAGLGPDSIDASRLLEVAGAIGDRGEHGRCFEFAHGVAVMVDANTVSISAEQVHG